MADVSLTHSDMFCGTGSMLIGITVICIRLSQHDVEARTQIFLHVYMYAVTVSLASQHVEYVAQSRGPILAP